jgi:hypothetical protein
MSMHRLSSRFMIGPGDLVMTYDPGNLGFINWSSEIFPGMTGIVLSEAYWNEPLLPGHFQWSKVVDIRFNELTLPCAILLLKKLRPPPQEEERIEEELCV